jgi:hypothetical protein
MASPPAKAAEPRRDPRTAGWQQPMPFARSGDSYNSYYRRGVLPGANLSPSQPQHMAPVLQAPMAQPTVPAAERLAPLVDADTYRHSRSGAVLNVPARRPAAPGTWLATYQKLVGRPPAQPQQPATRTPAKRSISSDY